MSPKHHLIERDSSGNIIGQQNMVTDKKSKDTAYLSNLSVDPEHRRKGIGSRLMKAAESLAKAVGLKKTKLEVDADNPAVAMYQRRGYVEIGRKNGKNGKVYIIMTKNVDNND